MQHTYMATSGVAPIFSERIKRTMIKLASMKEAFLRSYERLFFVLSNSRFVARNNDDSRLPLSLQIKFGNSTLGQNEIDSRGPVFDATISITVAEL